MLESVEWVAESLPIGWERMLDAVLNHRTYRTLGIRDNQPVPVKLLLVLLDLRNLKRLKHIVRNSR